MIRNLYLHYPFCTHRCSFCAFPIHALGSGEGPHISELKSRYTSRLISELKVMLPQFSSRLAPFETVYFGGGTPSLAPIEDIQAILSTIRNLVGLAPNAEVTLEAHPSTLNPSTPQRWKDIGINRVSLGIQSLSSKAALKDSKRQHGIEEALFAAKVVIEAMGRRGTSLDLLAGLPGETLSDFHESVQKAIDMGVGHLSVYALSIEPGTSLANKIGQKPDVLSSLKRPEKYRKAQTLLQDFYNQYEVASFHLKGHPELKSRHNETYWDPNRDFLAVGMGAASLINGRRFARPSTLKEYFDYVHSLETSGCYDENQGESEVDSPYDSMKIAAMARLRTEKGASYRQFIEAANRAKLLSLEQENRVVGALDGFRRKFSEVFEDDREDALVVRKEEFGILEDVLVELFIAIDRLDLS